MARARLFHGCLVFDSLDAGSDLQAAFTVGYRFLDDHEDVWTSRFTSFKAGQSQAERAGKRLMSRMACRVLGKLDVLPSDVTFVPALRSAETKAAADSILSRIAKQSANKYQAFHDRKLLRKNRHSSLHSAQRTRDERENIIASANYASRAVNTSNVVVIDDFITAGSTLCAIARAIQKRNPGITVYGMALAKNDRLSWLHTDATNDHISSKWNRKWQNCQ